MFVFDWFELATDSVISRLLSILGIDPPGENHLDSIRTTLAVLYKLVGGLNLSNEDLNITDRDALAFELIEEACEHTLSLLTTPVTTAGYVTSQATSDLPFGSRASVHEVIAVNSSTQAQLDDLPGVGPVLAGRIIDARHSAGWFESAEELDERVAGIGPEVLKEAANVLSYKAPLFFGIDNVRGLDERFRLVHSLTRSAEAPLTATLELLITACGRNPHPYTLQRRQRPTNAASFNNSPTQWVAVLDNENYHPGVQSLFDDATNSIDVCLFHIALGAPQHPTRAVVDRLVAASQRGVAVRVIIDRDRPTDPYLSTVVNTPAKEFLDAQGVPTRWDPPDRLLHSKFLIIDGAVAVIGSHNWSIGSFFEYDDLSLVLESQGLVDALLLRFNSLWELSTPS